MLQLFEVLLIYPLPAMEGSNARVASYLPGPLTCWGEVSPGDDRLRSPICHAHQGHIAALIHGDIRGDVGDLWWNCEDKRWLDLVI